MNSMLVTVEYGSGTRRQLFQLPTDVTCEKLSSIMVRRLELPTEEEEGTLVEYRLRHKERGRWLSGRDTLDKAGIEEDDVLQLERYYHRDWRPMGFMVLLLIAAVVFCLFLILSS